MAVDGHTRPPIPEIMAVGNRNGTDYDLAVLAAWKTLLGRLINDAGRLRLLPHRVVMFLLLAHHGDRTESEKCLDAASKELAEWQRIARGISTNHADVGVSPSVSPILTAFMTSRRGNFDDYVDRFGQTATRLIGLMAKDGHQYAQLSALADFVASDLLRCMNQLVADFAAELGDMAEGERNEGLTTRRAVAALETSAATVARLANELARVNASVRMIALNATMEAARSGDNGRVFGAVALEIKELSGKIANLTADIRAHLQRT